MTDHPVTSKDEGDLARLAREIQELKKGLLERTAALHAERTARQEAARALIESERRYRSLYHAMNEGVALYQVVYDEAGRATDYIILDVNPAFESITGLTKSLLVDGRAAELYRADIPLQVEMIAACAEFDQKVSFEIQSAAMNKFLRISAFRTGPDQVATVIEDITQSKKAEQKIEHLANFDLLTNLPNRRLFKDRLSQGVIRAKRSQTKLALLFVDLDFFKKVNDTFGHKTGDAVLVEVANRLSGLLRASDTVARMGGDEFVVILEELKQSGDSVRIAERIISRVNEPIRAEGNACHIGASVGITLFPDFGSEPAELIRQADKAMYAAKERGRNIYVVFTPDLGALAVKDVTTKVGR